MNTNRFLKKNFEQYDIARVWACELQCLVIQTRAKDAKIEELKEKIKSLETQLAQEEKAPFVKLYA